MLNGRRAVIGAALAAVSIAAVAAGCGGGSTSSSSSGLKLDPVSAAATKTQNAGAAKIRFAMAMSGQGLQGKTIHLGGTGAIDGTSSEMNIKLGSMLSQMGLSSAQTGAIGALGLKNASMKELILEQNGDEVIYMRMPSFLSSQMPGGKAWMKLDLSKFGKSAGIDMSKLMSGSQFQPSDALGMLEAQGADVQKVGPATIDGVATTKYSVKIDVAKALKASGVTSPLFKSEAGQMKTIDADVWVDNGGLVRRVQFAYNLPQAAHLAMTMDLYDYGAHVSIAAPPSSQVFDMTQLAQQGFGSTH
ncbi:MAG TPA: LppX_LprAFG lipoprotein [Gaiellaceae bacterium]|nr:LppX_LprAFG lipoprotein [Gaiellaceae bacterium]